MTERPPAEDELLVDDGDDEVAGERPRLDLPLEIDLDAGAIASEATPARPSGEQRARFVAEGQPLGSDGRMALEADEDDPTVAFRPLGPDERDTHSTVRLRRDPPALPPPLHPSDAPNVVLGPGLSTRGEITERVHLIPKTHPMANSIAPGGSALSMTPPPKPAPRGLFATGAAVLVLLGVGAAHYLQSRGEHHAATEHGEPAPHAAALPPAEREGEPATPTPAETAMPTPAASRAAATSAPAPEAVAPQRAGSNDIARAAPQAPLPKSPPKATDGAEPDAAEQAPGRAVSIKAELGEAALQPGGRPFRPTLAQIAAGVEGVRDQVRACAGDTHGIADVVLRVNADGSVTHVLVQSGPFADSPAGSCIAKALRKARVAPFGKPVVHVLYTLKI